MNKGDIPKTAVITPFGLFEWIRMPFGLRNAGCTFQRMMDQILGDIPHCFVYVNDLLIASPDATSHLDHVRQVFDRLRLHGLSINPAKSEFAKPEFEYLGMMVSSKGWFPLQKHTEVISSFPRPVDKKGLQRFLGILNFYWRFIKGAAGILAPLTEGLKGKVSTISWTLEMNQAFAVAKSLLSSVPTVSTGIHRPLVPEAMRKNVFNAIHKISHPGKRVSRKLVSRSFVWEFLSKDVNLWAQSCLDCQRSKIQSHVKSPGPLPQSDGFSYLFTIIDRSTRWPEAIPLKSTTAEECRKSSYVPGFLYSEYLL